MPFSFLDLCLILCKAEIGSFSGARCQIVFFFHKLEVKNAGWKHSNVLSGGVWKRLAVRQARCHPAAGGRRGAGVRAGLPVPVLPEPGALSGCPVLRPVPAMPVLRASGNLPASSFAVYIKGWELQAREETLSRPSKIVCCSCY